MGKNAVVQIAELSLCFQAIHQNGLNPIRRERFSIAVLRVRILFEKAFAKLFKIFVSLINLGIPGKAVDKATA